MRNLLWGGIALMVCAGAGVYVLARYASRHPETFYERTVQVVRDAQPDERTGQTMPEPFPAKPVLAGPMTFGPESEASEVVEPIVIDGGDDQRPRLNLLRTGPIFVPDGEETAEPPISRAAERLPQFMPYADELVLPPSRPCGGFFGWLDSGDPCPSDLADCDGCLWMLELVEQLWQVMQGPWAHEMGPVQTPEVPIVDDPREIRLPYGLPDFREDPNYHHHYPSCPYTGGCPYPYHYRLMQPVQPVKPVMPPTPPAPESTKSIVPTSVAVPAPRLPGDSHVDTMECRPSDLSPPLARNRPF